MNNTLLKYSFAFLFVGILAVCGCTPANEPTGPEDGSIQAYLDDNPDLAALADEDSEQDEDADDGSGE